MFKELITKVMNLGGDDKTNAAITGAIYNTFL